MRTAYLYLLLFFMHFFIATEAFSGRMILVDTGKSLEDGRVTRAFPDLRKNEGQYSSMVSRDSVEGKDGSVAGIQESSKKPNEITILWDNSYSAQNRKFFKEYDFLEAYFRDQGNVKVTLQPFGYILDSIQTFFIEKGEWTDLKDALERQLYDGAQREQSLNSVPIGAHTFLFSDGIGFPEDIADNWHGKVFTINTNPGGNHQLLKSIARTTGANYINLSQIDNSSRALAYTRDPVVDTLDYIPIDNSANLREIKGNVSDFDDPIANVRVEVQGTDRKTRTDAAGNFRIAAQANELLKFSYPGRESVETFVNSNTSHLNIAMPVGVNVLDEVVLEEDRRLEELNAPLQQNVTTNFGVLDPRKTGFAVKQILGEELNWVSRDITDAIRGKFPGVRIVIKYPEEIPYIALRGGEVAGYYAAWDLDGMIYPFDRPPLGNINIQNVKSITIMPGSWAASRYGAMARGGIIIVRTISQSIHEMSVSPNGMIHDRARVTGNVYEDDAISPGSYIRRLPNYLAAIQEASTIENAYQAYLDQRNVYDHNASYFYDVSKVFQEKWEDRELSTRILSNLEEVFLEDPTALRIAAYEYEIRGLHHNALNLYRIIYDMNPDSQAIRDLGNSYSQTGTIKKAWELYKTYLMINDSLLAEGTDQIVKQEMLDLLENHKDLLGMDGYQPGTTDSPDVNLIVEWNNPNAQFELQFVGPDNLFYTWHNGTNLPSKNSLKGYTSYSFDIEDISKGPWLINAKYLGNQENTPSFLKFTIRNHQLNTENTKVIKLQSKNVKYEILRVLPDKVVSSLN